LVLHHIVETPEERASSRMSGWLVAATITLLADAAQFSTRLREDTS
jgi:hypothetical protein